MKKLLMNKKFVTIIAIITLLITTSLLTGCNKQIIDLDYSYDKAICVIGNESKEIKIKSWTDYENGEQLQLKDTNGNTYLVSSINCTLIRED